MWQGHQCGFICCKILVKWAVGDDSTMMGYNLLNEWKGIVGWQGLPSGYPESSRIHQKGSSFLIEPPLTRGMLRPVASPSRLLQAFWGGVNGCYMDATPTMTIITVERAYKVPMENSIVEVGKSEIVAPQNLSSFIFIWC